MNDELELLVPSHGKQEGEQVSVALPKAALTLHGTLSAHSASPRETTGNVCARGDAENAEDLRDE